MSDCLFCKIIAGEIPSNKVYEDDVCYAFYDIDPQAPVHFLVIPTAHISSVSAVTEENCAAVGHIFRVIAELTQKLHLDSYRVVSNIGEQAGQSVRHLHFHVLSGRDMTWPPGVSAQQGSHPDKYRFRKGANCFAPFCLENFTFFYKKIRCNSDPFAVF